MKLKLYTKELDLSGMWHVSYKIDGTQVHITGGGDAVSRANKRLKSLEAQDFISTMPAGIYEFYRDSWGETQSLLKNAERADEILETDLYVLAPWTDDRLKVCSLANPTHRMMKDLFEAALKKGYEGLVLQNDTTGQRYKMKTTHTIDVRVTGVIEGKGRNVGRLGAIITDKGKIGTGLTDALRVELWEDPGFIGSIVEAQCMEFTDKGLMRHPRFVRRRTDKDEENFDG